MSLGSNIKKFRLNQDLKQSELAEKAGISRVAVGNYERDERIPNAEILLKIAEALNVTLIDLMDLAPDDHDAIAEIANKTHTHPAYIKGKTKEKDVFKWDLELTIKDLDYKKLKDGINIYPEELQNAIILLWNIYLNDMISDWYYEGSNAAAKDIDIIYFSSTINGIFEDFRGYINNLTENIDKNNRIEFFDMEAIYNKKAKVLNTISYLLDIVISRTILNKDENEIAYLPEIIKQYGNKEEN